LWNYLTAIALALEVVLATCATVYVMRICAERQCR
jgi:hypothetical protein